LAYRATTASPSSGAFRATHLSFGPPEWLPADALDDTYFRVLPSGPSSMTVEEAAMLATVFGEDGEIPAQPMGGALGGRSIYGRHGPS
jgi:hypothetical protein